MDHAAIRESKCREAAAVDAARVEAGDIVDAVETELGPVAEEQRITLMQHDRRREPRPPSFRRVVERSVEGEARSTVRSDHAQPGENRCGGSQPLVTVEIRAPCRVAVADQSPHECLIFRARKTRRHLISKTAGELDAPLRHQPTVNHHEPPKAVNQRPRPQPPEELVTVRGSQNLVEGVLFFGPGHAGGTRQQVEIMVAQHRDQSLAVLAGPTQHLERKGTAVDEIAHQPQLVAFGLPLDTPEQTLQRFPAAVDVTNDPCRHHSTLHPASVPASAPGGADAGTDAG